MELRTYWAAARLVHRERPPQPGSGERLRTVNWLEIREDENEAKVSPRHRSLPDGVDRHHDAAHPLAGAQDVVDVHGARHQQRRFRRRRLGDGPASPRPDCRYPPCPWARGVAASPGLRADEGLVPEPVRACVAGVLPHQAPADVAGHALLGADAEADRPVLDAGLLVLAVLAHGRTMARLLPAVVNGG